jgi:hypothetical protein
MRAFLELVEADRLYLPETEVASFGAPLLSVLRDAGIVRDEDPGMVELSLSDLGRTLRKLYGVLSRGLALPSSLDERPVLLGWTGEGASLREVILVAHPTRGLSFALRRSQRSLVLVPTSRALTDEVRARHGAGALVEVEALEEALVVQGGRLVRRRAPHPALHATAPATLAAGVPTVGKGRALLGGATRWNQVGVCLVNYALLRVDLPGRSVRCTAADLGMAHPRSRKPTVLWEALVALCEEHGYFKTTRFGGVAATKKVVSRLRARLHELFDLKLSPFHRYRRGTGWQARFVARPDLPSDKIGGGPGGSRRVSLGDKSDGPVDDEVDFSEGDPSR